MLAIRLSCSYVNKTISLLDIKTVKSCLIKFKLPKGGVNKDV